MYIKEEEIEELEAMYGPSERVVYEPIPMLDWEYRLLVSSRKHGRSHDVTMFIEKDGAGKYVCIQKPFYRDTGIFRAPSGGVKPGEGVEDGLKREMREETGLHVEIDRFILIIETEFTGPERSDRENWTSYVFTGHDVGGELGTRDPVEISAVGLFDREEMLGPIRDRMIESGWGGFSYRAKLTGDAFKIIGNGTEPAT